MPYTPILATLGYVMSPDGKETLLIHRNTRADDHHLGKYNGLGGKLESDEDIVAGLRAKFWRKQALRLTMLSYEGRLAGLALESMAKIGSALSFGSTDTKVYRLLTILREPCLGFPLTRSWNCRCGRGIVIFSPYCLAMTPANSMGSCPMNRATP